MKNTFVHLLSTYPIADIVLGIGGTKQIIFSPCLQNPKYLIFASYFMYARHWYEKFIYIYALNSYENSMIEILLFAPF